MAPPCYRISVKGLTMPLDLTDRRWRVDMSLPTCLPTKPAYDLHCEECWDGVMSRRSQSCCFPLESREGPDEDRFSPSNKGMNNPVRRLWGKGDHSPRSTGNQNGTAAINEKYCELDICPQAPHPGRWKEDCALEAHDSPEPERVAARLGGLRARRGLPSGGREVVQSRSSLLRSGNRCRSSLSLVLCH